MASYQERLMTEIVEDENGCWIFPNRKLQTGGYVWLRIGGSKSSTQRRAPAQVIVWEYLRGPVPVGLILDHLCRNRACCRPEHCEPVTQRENLLRGDTLAAKNAAKTHCKYGHEFTEENTYIGKKGSRYCRLCQARAQREYYARKKVKTN